MYISFSYKGRCTAYTPDFKPTLFITFTKELDEDEIHKRKFQYIYMIFFTVLTM